MCCKQEKKRMILILKKDFFFSGTKSQNGQMKEFSREMSNTSILAGTVGFVPRLSLPGQSSHLLAMITLAPFLGKFPLVDESCFAQEPLRSYTHCLWPTPCKNIEGSLAS
jgi:hypothetical protein